MVESAFPQGRRDVQMRMARLLNAVRLFFRARGRVPTVAEVVELLQHTEPGITDKTIYNYVNRLGEQLGIVHSDSGGKHPDFVHHVWLTFLIRAGEIEMADRNEPHLPITPEMTVGLEALPELKALVDISKRLHVGASASRDENETMKRLELLMTELERVRAEIRPTFAPAQELFGLDLPNTSFRAGGEHPVWDTHQQSRPPTDQLNPHPDNRSALQSVLGTDFLEAANIVHPEQLLTAFQGNIIAVGGPPSEFLSRIHLGYHGAYDRFRRRSDLLPLQFWQNCDAAEVQPEAGTAVRFFWDYRRRQFIMSRRPNWWICSENSKPFIPQVDHDGYVVTDYLLITRLRNCFSDDPDTKFTHIGGAHGTGTKAIGLLTSSRIDRGHRRLLNDIKRELGGGAAEFQILLKVAHIKNACEPMDLDLVAAVPLHISDGQYEKLRAWIERELRETAATAHPKDRRPPNG